MQIVVKGRVQGVGFRATAKRIAEQQLLVGYASNCVDGSVSLCVQGPSEKLKHFLRMLQERFPAPYIVEIAVVYTEPKTHYSDFSTR